MEFRQYERDGLILSRDIEPRFDDTRILVREVAHGRIVKLRRGAYVDRERWDESSSRERHLLRVRAVAAQARHPILVAGVSAASVWGMPVAGDFPDAVTLAAPWRGGGRSEPGVIRSSYRFSGIRPTDVDGIQVTDVGRTALDVARHASFEDATGSVDWALWRKNPRAISRSDLGAEIERMNPRAGRRRLERLAVFATELSDSFGESRCRAVIQLLGFDAPRLQQELRDDRGHIRPDFLWPVARVAGEFDGRVKYFREEFTEGDPSGVVWQEKLREDRLRTLGFAVVRFVWSDLEHPERLERLLLAAGVPRGGRS